MCSSLTKPQKNAKPQLSGFYLYTNQYNIQIKKKLHQLTHTTSSKHTINFIWIPSHIRIQGNEIADTAAKEATNNVPNTDDNLLLPDALSHLKEQIWKQTQQSWLLKASTKGTSYFHTFFYSVKTSWFHKHKLPRHITLWVIRYKTNHYNLAASLARVGITRDGKC
ncbi:hypothetical protein ANTQUA_LOCUS2284 [Anthophora quadrimaculata]